MIDTGKAFGRLLCPLKQSFLAASLLAHTGQSASRCCVEYAPMVGSMITFFDAALLRNALVACAGSAAGWYIVYRFGLSDDFFLGYSRFVLIAVAGVVCGFLLAGRVRTRLAVLAAIVVPWFVFSGFDLIDDIGMGFFYVFLCTFFFVVSGALTVVIKRKREIEVIESRRR